MSSTSTPVIQNKLLSDEVKKTPLTPCRRVGLGRPSSGLKKLSVKSNNSTPRNIEPERLQIPEYNKNEDEKPLNCTNINVETHEVPSIKSGDSNKKLLSRRNLSLTRTKGLIAKRALCDIDLNGFDDQSISFLSSNNHTTTPKIEMSQKNCAKKQKISCDKTSYLVHSSPIFDHRRLHFDTENSDNNALRLNTNNVDVTTAIINELVSSIKEKKNRLELLTVQQTYSKKHDLEDLRDQTRKWRLAGQEALRYSVSIAQEAGFPVSIKQLIDGHGFSADLIQYNEEDDDFS